MPIDAEALRNAALNDVPVSYTAADVMLYGIGIGLGSDPLDSNELPYVTEHRNLQTLPTFASMVIPETLVAESGCDLQQILHRSQSLQIFRPLPPAAELLVNQRIAAVTDRGAVRGAEIELETELRMARDDTVVCHATSRIIARGDGGFGGKPAPRKPRHRMPNREPDLVCDLPTRPNQALLFRLCGDFNPLHSDPAVAQSAGFDRPILHGRCTHGIACHAVLKTVCNYDFTLINGFDVRFSSPVFPGDIVTTEMWQDGNVVSFRCRVREREAVVINGGRCTLQA
jgi:acyl dehydratase